MSVSEHDLEIMESWLDGELSEEQVEILRRRISSEPHLSQTLDRLRNDRQLRAGIWRGMEPTERQAETLVANVRRLARREDVIDSRLRLVRNFAAVAASVSVVFFAGWLTRGRLQVGSQVPKEQIVQLISDPIRPNDSIRAFPQPVVQTARPQYPQVAPGNNVPVSFGGNTPSVGNSGTFMSFRTPSDPRRTVLPRYKVDVISPMGDVFSYQLDKLSDLADLQQKVEEQEMRLRQQVPSTPQLFPRSGTGSSQVVPVGSEQSLPGWGR